MKALKEDCEVLGLQNVTTYINSGNILFESNEKKELIKKRIEESLKTKTGQDIRTIIKTKEEINKIASAIPSEWTNDTAQKTDVLFLSDEIDNEEIINELPINKEYLHIKYVQGAVIINVLRSDYQKSKINKIIGYKKYKEMTVRNVNTARYLASFEH
jgi:uncharacterized protein (DUF1697 family)